MARFIFPLATALQSGGCEACAVANKTNCPAEKIVTIRFFDGGQTSRGFMRICEEHWNQLIALSVAQNPFTLKQWK